MSDAVTARLEAVAARLEAAVAKLGGGSATGGAESTESKIPPQVVAYDALYAAHVQPLVDTCNKLEGVHDIGAGIETAFKTQRNLFLAAAACKKPTQPELMKFVDPIVQVVTKAQNTDNRSPVFSHQKTFAEMIQLMNWIFQPGPVAVIKGTLEAADFYLIKILTSAKDAANEEDKKNHRAYVQQIKDLINHFAEFVKEHYLTGIIWNAKGISISEFKAGGSAVPAAPVVPAGALPPPPPPVDLNLKLADPPAPAPAGKGPGGFGAVFAEINNKGDGVTTGLKKVTSDMKTKNMKDVPTLAPKSSQEAKPVASKPAVEEAKSSSLTLKQGTWFCEHYRDTQVDISEVEMKQNVYIYKAQNAVITIPTKCKSIQLDNCVKTGIVFGSVVSTFEIVNCKSVTIQVNENCPSITIDKSSGVSIVLNEVSLQNPPNIVTSLTGELNVVIPGKTPEDDPVELPVPQQYVTTISNGSLTTVALLHKG